MKYKTLTYIATLEGIQLRNLFICFYRTNTLILIDWLLLFFHVLHLFLTLYHLSRHTLRCVVACEMMMIRCSGSRCVCLKAKLNLLRNQGFNTLGRFEGGLQNRRLSVDDHWIVRIILLMLALRRRCGAGILLHGLYNDNY